MALIEEILKIPVLQIVVTIILMYMLKLALSTYKSWLRYLQVKIITAEYKLINGNKELKDIIKERVDSGLTKSIEQNLGVKED